MQEDNNLFRCPLCFQEIFGYQIQEHMQNCDFYSPHGSPDVSISSSSNSPRECFKIPDSLSELKDYFGCLKSQSNPFISSVAACPVCLDHFNNDRLLPLLLPKCGHTICKGCLKNIQFNTFEISCPICRRPIREEISLLPVNIALLELKAKDQKKCEAHGHEYMAYCKNDSTLLCGACILDHKSHNCVLLSDKSLLPIAAERKKTAKTTVAELKLLKRQWEDQLKELKEYSSKIEEAVEVHQSAIKATEALLINEIQSNSKTCYKELQECSNNHQTRSANAAFAQTLLKINEEISNLTQKLEMFEDLATAEKLLPSSLPSLLSISRPDINFLKSLLEKFETPLDYKQAIKAKKLF